MATASSGSSHFGVTQDQKRWLVAGIALNKILIPQIRPFVEQGINTEYNNLKTIHNIHGQSTSGRLQRWPRRKLLKYENINGNDVHPRLPGGRLDYSLFDCRVMSHVDFARMYVENYMAHFTAFDDHCDASAVLTLLGGVPAFSAPVQTAAADVRMGRNDWAHCVFSKWDQVKYQQSFIDMEHLVRVLALPAADEGKILGELKDWETKGTHLCLNSPIDPALLQLVQQELQSLQNAMKNMSVEFEEAKRKVQHELQNIATTLEEMTQRVQTLEHRTGLVEGRMHEFEGDVNLKVERLKNSHQSMESRTALVEDKVYLLQEQVADLSVSKEPSMTSSCQDTPMTAVYPEKLVELIKRDYKGAVVCPLPWCENELQLELSNIFTRLTMTSKEKERAKKTGKEVKMTDVFTPHKECDKPRVVLIEGQPGMGKTIYCQKLAYDWSVAGIPPEASFPDVKMLLLLKCRDMKMMNANIEEAIDNQMLPQDADKKEKENFFEFIRRNQSKILLVLDGLDELRHDLLQGFLPLIKGKVFSNTYLMLTARHEAGMEIRRYCDTLLDIVGYTSEDAESYITKYFRNHEDPSLGNALIEKVKYDGQLRELTANPLNTALLCLVCEETKGAFPSNKTKLYGDLVSFALRRDFAKKNEKIPSDPIETCEDQLNQLGRMALEALKDDRMHFSEEEMECHSINFLKCFLSREASVSKIRPAACYAFTHKTFQEFFAAFYLEHEMFARDKPRRDALLAQLSPVDKYWQVWEFLFTMVMSKSHDDAIYLLSRLCACLYHEKPEKLIKAEPNANLKAHICKDTCYNWLADIGRLTKEEELVQSLLTKALDLIAECESDENELKDYQKKMVLTLARCFPVRKFELDENLGDSLVVSEYLKVNRTLTHLRLDGSLDEVGLATIKIVLQPDHKLAYLSLNLGYRDVFLMNDDAHWYDAYKMRLLKVEALAEFLQGNRTLTHLSLRLIPYQSAFVLARAFQFNRTLTHLSLAWSIIDSVEAEVLAEALRSNCSLTHLSLPRNSITDLGADAFAKVLLLDCGLLYLDLSDNCISDGGVIALAQTLEQGPGLASNATLTYLDLSQQYFSYGCARLGYFLDNGIIGESGASALARALRTNCSLTYLNLGYNAIGETGAAAIGEALQSNCNLTHLYLTKNKIGDRGAEALAKALQSERTFTELNPLEQSSIEDSGVAELHFALAKAIHGSCSIRVTRLELNSNNICCSGAAALADALLSNYTLRRLGLNSNKIACSGAEALAKALQSNRSLAHLDLGGNKIGDSGATEFAETINKNYTLTYLNLSSNPIGELGAQNLARVDQSTCDLKYDESYSEK